MFTVQQVCPEAENTPFIFHQIGVVGVRKYRPEECIGDGRRLRGRRVRDANIAHANVALFVSVQVWGAKNFRARLGPLRSLNGVDMQLVVDDKDQPRMRGDRRAFTHRFIAREPDLPFFRRNPKHQGVSVEGQDMVFQQIQRWAPIQILQSGYQCPWVRDVPTPTIGRSLCSVTS